MSSTERKCLTCFCYCGGKRRILPNGTFQYVGGVSEAVLIEDNISYEELLSKISSCLNIILYDKFLFYNTKRDKTKYVRVKDQNGVKMLFHLNEDEVDVFVAKHGCMADPIHPSARESNQVDNNHSQIDNIVPTNDSSGGNTIASSKPGYTIDPGPIDPSLLVLQSKHRSHVIWEAAGQGRADSTVLTCRRAEASLRRRGAPSEAVLDLVRRAGFTGLLEVPFVSLDWHLITALVERWRPETHTFHLRSGEATVTLQDAELLLGLRVDGNAVTGCSNLDWEAECQRLLGAVPKAPNDRKGGRVRLTWLRDKFTGEVKPGAAAEEVAWQARGYILQLIGGTIFSDHSGQFVHLMYLPLLEDFDTAGKYSWGSAALAMLYYYLCHGAEAGAKDVGGPFILLQVWAWDRFPHLSPRRLGRLQPPVGSPLIGRWHDQFRTLDLPTHVVSSYRYTLDRQTDTEVVWVPYSPELIAGLPEYCRAGAAVWRACVPLVCFAIMEMHQPERVLRQFGFRQSPPPPSQSLHAPHGQDLRGGATDWRITRAAAIKQWEDRLQHVVPMVVPDDGLYPPEDPYTTWYIQVTRRFVSRLGASMMAMRLCLVQLQGREVPGEQVQALAQRALELYEEQHCSLRAVPPPPPPPPPPPLQEDPVQDDGSSVPDDGHHRREA